jgi:hypothetical protein
MAISPYKQTVGDYIEQMKAKGFVEIGHGIAGTVFEHPSNPRVVVKVQTGLSNHSDMKWVSWCLKNRNPWAVKVLKIRTLPTVDIGFAIYMEKLTPATANQVRNELTAGGAAGRSSGACLYPKGTHWRFVPGFNGDTSGVADKDLAEVLSVIYKLTRRAQGKLQGATDMKPSNFLMRGRQLVFVDPIA